MQLPVHIDALFADDCRDYENDSQADVRRPQVAEALCEKCSHVKRIAEPCLKWF